MAASPSSRKASVLQRKTERHGDQRATGDECQRAADDHRTFHRRRRDRTALHRPLRTHTGLIVRTMLMIAQVVRQVAEDSATEWR